MPMDELGALDAVAEVIQRHVHTHAFPDKKRLSA
jgi:hypothetical protein